MERLTEKDFNFTSDFVKSNLQSWSIAQALKKLQEYEDLEEQGKLLKLPCAVGDTVYSFSFVKVLTFRVDSFVIYADGIDARLVSDMDECKPFKADLDIADFGKKWFATREEAEAGLKDWFMS